MTETADLHQLVRDRLRLTPMPGMPDIALYTAHSGSGLSRLAGGDGRPPYWAYPWAGGLVLARYLFDHPESVRGLSVLDMGAGSGLVGIVAAKAGARRVLACEVDAAGQAAIALNAEANGVRIDLWQGDLAALPPVDVVLAGDVFYDRAVAARMRLFLGRCAIAGKAVLVGDPGRKDLPLASLRRLAEYPVPDFGGNGDGVTKPSAVYQFLAS